MELNSLPLKWAQDKSQVFMTLEAKNLAEEARSISLSPEGHLHFQGTNKVNYFQYSLDLNLFDEVNIGTTKWKVTDFAVQFSISKKNPENGFWPRLTKEKKKFHNITIDWTRWVDEDESDEKNIKIDSEGFEDLPGEEDEELVDSYDLDAEEFLENISVENKD